jgi:PadR family transcriptional regulator, regulatory protein AphA
VPVDKAQIEANDDHPTAKRLSTTAYCMLGLLALRDWTTYELADQMTRGVGDLWSAARSMLFSEPKHLAASGLAFVRRESTGRRPRAVYSISPAGRDALHHWLTAPGAPPALQFEGALKVLLADSSNVGACQSSVAAARAWAEALQDVGRQVAREYLVGNGPFQDRVFQVSLTFALLWNYSAAVLEWAEWADAQLRAHEDGRTDDVLEPFRRALAGRTVDA